MKLSSSSTIRLRLRQAGFSLVETLMATGIISTAALSTLGLLAGSMSASQDGNLRSKAIVIAQDLFHDLQLGSLNVTPAVTDERQTKTLRPATGRAMPRQVLLYDQSGLLLVGKQPAKSAHQRTYDQGTLVEGADWLVSIEGIENNDFILAAGNGQVTELPAEAMVVPLGSSNYSFPAVASPIDPTLPPPGGGLTQVRISIETPPSAPKNRRKKFSYDFYWNR